LQSTYANQRVILLSTWVYEHLEMSIICLGMLLRLPHLQMAGWGIYRLPHTSNRWTQSSSFLSTLDGHTGQSGAHWTYIIHCKVPATSVDRWGL
jgi:hypothetical protein